MKESALQKLMPSFRTVARPVIYHLLFIIYYLSFIISAQAQQIGSWQVYPAYSVCTRNIPVGHRVYALMESKLMAYDTDDQSVTTFDWMRQLNDVTIDFIHFSDEAKRIIIVYDNGNIDLLSTADDYDVINLAQLKNSTLQNKQVNNVQVQGTLAYICTGFGIVVVDMKEGIIRETYQLEMNVTACAASETTLYASTDSGLWSGAVTDNLQDKSLWQLVDVKYKTSLMEYFDGHVWLAVGTWVGRTDESHSGFVTTFNNIGRPTYMTKSNGKLIIGNASHVYVFDSTDSQQHLTGSFTWNNIAYGNKDYWASDGYAGLQAYTLNADGTFSLATPAVHADGPPHDYSLHMRWAGDRLMISGGHQNYSPTSRPGTAYILEPDGSWTVFDYASGVAIDPKSRFLDVTNIAQDPNDASHYYLGTARSGIYEYRDYKCVGHIGMENAPFHSILPENPHPQWFVVADGLTYDPDGNLWTLNCTEGARDTTIRVMRPNGSWLGIPCSEIKEASTLDRIFFDTDGRAWINSRRMNARGIFMLDTNGSIDRTSDDRRQHRGTIVNQDGTSYSPDEFYSFAEDADGQIWIGTNLGPFRINNPADFRDKDFRFEQVKVSRTDGSGLADYLLSGIPILSIAIDGGQRLWFGTAGNGLYLISADCQEELYHFTTDNSPLPSNNIYDIAVDGRTGRVFVATDKGLCSYLSDATDPEPVLEEKAVYAFPNPVDPDYHGPIVVRGLTNNAEVKITSSTGQLIWQGTSNGGTFSWNGCNRHGRRVASGIYNVIATTSDGDNAIVTRIAFIR